MALSPAASGPVPVPMEESGESSEAPGDDVETAMAVDSTASKAASSGGSADGSRDHSSIQKSVLGFLIDTAWRAGQGWHAPQVIITAAWHPVVLLAFQK